MKKNNQKKHICPCTGKMCSFGYCTDCNNFSRTSEDWGYCKKTGEYRNYGDPCRIDGWEPIC